MRRLWISALVLTSACCIVLGMTACGTSSTGTATPTVPPQLVLPNGGTLNDGIGGGVVQSNSTPSPGGKPYTLCDDGGVGHCSIYVLCRSVSVPLPSESSSAPTPTSTTTPKNCLNAGLSAAARDAAPSALRQNSSAVAALAANTLSPSPVGTVTITCLGTDQMLGGGFTTDVAGSGSLRVVQSYPTQRIASGPYDSWTVTAVNDYPTTPRFLSAYVYCIRGGTPLGITVVTSSSVLTGAPRQATAQAMCGSEAATSGGFSLNRTDPAWVDYVTTSQPYSDGSQISSGWTAMVYDAMIPDPVTLTAYALCAASVYSSQTHVAHAALAVSSSNEWTGAVACPSGTWITGGGFNTEQSLAYSFQVDIEDSSTPQWDAAVYDGDTNPLSGNVWVVCI
jgi:hypothetical protein